MLPLAAALLSLCLVAAFCDCPSMVPIGDPISSEAVTATTNITGAPVDSRGFVIPGEFIVNVKNPSNGLIISERFANFEFEVTIPIPSFADDNDTLLINITDLSSHTVYGNATVQLTNVYNTTAYHVEVTILYPPPNYSFLYIILFAVVMGAIIGAYAYFTRWFIGRMVVKKASEIRLKEWKRQGGGNLNP